MVYRHRGRRSGFCVLVELLLVFFLSALEGVPG